MSDHHSKAAERALWVAGLLWVGSAAWGSPAAEAGHVPGAAEPVTSLVDTRCDEHACARVRLDDGENANNVLDTTPAGGPPATLFWGDETMWTSGRDGEGSGLDADRLDGLDHLAFLRTGEMGLRIVAGSVAPTGTILSGAGFAVSRVDVGRYHVVFDPAFSAPPVVVATAHSGDTRDAPAAAVLDGDPPKNGASFDVLVRQTNDFVSSVPQPAWEFIAIGPG